MEGRMAQQPRGTEKISLHLEPEQIAWLRAQAAAIKARSCSVIARQAIQAAMDAEAASKQDSAA